MAASGVALVRYAEAAAKAQRREGRKCKLENGNCKMQIEAPLVERGAVRHHALPC